MKIQILQANLGDFDHPVDPVKQDTEHEVSFHRFTDENFPPITGLTPRLQYRIPKCFGWQYFPEADIIAWLDGSMTFERKDTIDWYLEKLGTNDVVFFRHPWRKTIKKEVEHIEKKLQENNLYIVSRYKNGLHKEAYEYCMRDKEFKDEKLFASTLFVYRNNEKVRDMMWDWWTLQSRFYSCDQVVLPFVIWKNKLSVTEIKENLFKLGHANLVSKHH